MLPALSLCLEEPETDLLERPPRNVKTEHLVDWKLLLQAYGFLGILESLCAMSMSVFEYLHMLVYVTYFRDFLQVFLVPAAQRCPLLQPYSRVWKLARSDRRAAVQGSECQLLHAYLNAVGVCC